MMGLSYLQNRYTKFSTKQSEEFNTASRSIKPGLIASGIVSAWTWAATLLQSSTVAYQYGGRARVRVHVLTDLQVRHCRAFLVRRWSHRADPNVLHLGLQGQDERAAMPHIPGDCLRTLWPSGASGLPLLRIRDQYTGWLAASPWRQRCGHCPDGDECLRRYVLDP